MPDGAFRKRFCKNRPERANPDGAADIALQAVQTAFRSYSTICALAAGWITKLGFVFEGEGSGTI